MKKKLRNKLKEKYGEYFVIHIYDKLNEGSPVGNLNDTIKYLQMIDKVRQETFGIMKE